MHGAEHSDFAESSFILILLLQYNC